MKHIGLFYIPIVLLCIVGCAHKKVFVDGHLNVVLASHERPIEDKLWAWTVAQYGVTIKNVIQPNVTSTTKTELNDVVFRNNGHIPHNKKVHGIYILQSHTVYYLIGEWGTLVHEYCHTLNRQLNVYNNPVQDENYCEMIRIKYEQNKELRRVKKDYAHLQDSLRDRL